MTRPSEASLYPAVKTFLEQQGYTVKGEIAGCDVVGVRPGEPPRLVIAEMKLGLSLDLVLQAVDRMASADEIWLAVPATRRGRDRDARARKLCRLLGFGLLAVHPRHHIEVLAEPTPTSPAATSAAAAPCSPSTPPAPATPPPAARAASRS